MFSDVLANIITELKAHKRKRVDIMQDCITNRLNASLKVYYDELSNSVSFLEAKGEERVIKSVDKDE